VKLAEYTETQCLPGHARPQRADGGRFLADGLASQRQLHRDADQDLRFYQGNVLAVIHRPEKLSMSRSNRLQVMCVQYWPGVKGHPESYGGITVSYSHEEQLANFVIRDFTLKKEGTVTRRYLH